VLQLARLVAAVHPTLVRRRLMQATERPTTARRPGYVPFCALLRVWLAVAGVNFGCLNPMPDDFPSERGNEAEAQPVAGGGGGQQETGSGVGDDESDPNAPALEDSEAPDAGAPLERDAGAGDTGAWDAGSSTGLAP
jgi:hypothetical protein